MSRAQAGKYAEALGRYKELMRGLGKEDQEEFAANFTDTLANAATAAGEYSVARQVYETLLERYGESPTLRQKIRDVPSSSKKFTDFSDRSLRCRPRCRKCSI